ncbi:MAG: CHASE3 domain-containing protein [Rhodospirillaceae bacterium]|nr:CHASE3 domain-containing protein [Rhodospirillaceae bacterium]
MLRRMGSAGGAARVLRQLGLWASVVLIAAISALSYYNIRDLLRAQDDVERTLTILREIERLVSIAKDAEIGQRGFLITGDDVYLARYRSAVQALPSAVARLRDLMSDSPEQMRRMVNVDELQRTGMRLLALNIEARRSGGAGAIDTGRLAQGKSILDGLRAEAGRIADDESKLLRERDEAASRRATYTVVALGLGALVSVGLIVFIFLRLEREAMRRRRAEAGLRDANAGLETRIAARTQDLQREVAERRDTEELMRAIVEEAPFAVIGLAPDRKVMLWNGAAERIFGYAAGEVIGKPYPLVPPGGEAEFDDIIRRTSAGERLNAYAVQRRHKSGRLVEITFGGAPLYHQDGTLRGMVFLLQDVTGIRSTERQLRQAQRMEAVGQLTGGIAHDFNNILSVVVGNLDLLADRLPERGKERDLADASLKGALRGAELVQRLLAFARRQPLAPRPIDLNERLPGLTALLQRVLGEAIQVKTSPGSGLWPAVADPAMMEDALLNLAINARDAMPAGGTLTIETGNATLDGAYAAANPEVAPGDYVMIAVSDTGCGMPPEVIERAFEPFFTTKDVGKGSGLGLSMVYGFVKQSAGHVKIYSEVGHGTSIKLYLPRAAAAAEAARIESAQPEPPLPRGSGRIRVVEDHPGVRDAAARMLVELGYRVQTVASGPAALSWLDKGEPVDLLFTDIVMPEGMNGRELAAEAQRRRPGLRCLFTTGYAEAAVQNGHGLGIDAHLIGKPYRKAELARMLRRSIEGRGNGQSNGNGDGIEGSGIVLGTARNRGES